jgi:hypothetical protein
MSDCCCHILGVRRHTWHHYPENYVVKNRLTEVVFLNQSPVVINNQEQYYFDEEHFVNPFGDINNSGGFVITNYQNVFKEIFNVYCRY